MSGVFRTGPMCSKSLHSLGFAQSENTAWSYDPDVVVGGSGQKMLCTFYFSQNAFSRDGGTASHYKKKICSQNEGHQQKTPKK